jgi:NAD(P)-dependent dehydrogenase (short-subunit alcohol dehydrogenase family)
LRSEGSCDLKAAVGNGTPKLALMTSLMGSIADSSGGFHAYRSSKAALNMVGHGLARELQADGIAVLLLHPGWVQTDMGGPNAPLKPQESIAGLRRVIAGADLAQTGAYLDYNGKALPW